MKDGGNLDQGGCSRSGNKQLHSLSALMGKPTDLLMDSMQGAQKGRKARNGSKGFGPSNQTVSDATY